MPTAARLLLHPLPVGAAMRPRHRARVTGASLALVVGVLASTASGASSAAALTRPDVHVLARELSGPDALVVAGGDLFVANGGDEDGTTVTELNASTGALVRVVSAAADQFIDPMALAVAGDDLFVMNGGSVDGVGGTLTELNASTGALVRVLSGPPPRFEPSAIAVAGGD